VGPYGRVDDCLIGNGCIINGAARHSILSTDAVIEAGARVVDSVLLPGAHVKAGAQVVRAIMGENSTVEENVHVGSVDQTKDTAVIGNDVVVGRGE
ncbi:MAG: glucose-1-phosphate adenylyltransferase, partial [Lancefieldella sp.]